MYRKQWSFLKFPVTDLIRSGLKWDFQNLPKQGNSFQVPLQVSLTGIDSSAAIFP